MFRFAIWLIGLLRSRHRPADQARYAVTDPATELVTVRLPDGRLVAGEPRTEPPATVPPTTGSPTTGHRTANVRGLNSAAGLPGGRGGPGGRPPGRRWLSRVPRWLRWTVLVVIVVAFFRRAVAWAVLAALSATLHFFGANVQLPHVTFGWPWSSPASSTTLVGPLVLQKIQGIDKPALGTTTFNFLFTHQVSKPMGFLPCWYSATFYAVGHASATVNLNPGPSWWKTSAGHYALRVISKPTASGPGQVAITMALPAPQLPQSVHDVSVDNTLSKPVSSDHSWTYPGLACGGIIKPQFSQSVLYAQAQGEAFRQATTVRGVTQPLIAAAEREATTIIGGNFVTPTLNALHYKVSRFAIRWVPAAPTG